MKPRTLILLLVAVACGLAASYMTSKVLKDRQSTTAPPEEKIAVLVASRSLPLGTSTKYPEKVFSIKYFIKGEEPKRAIRAPYDPNASTDEVTMKLYEQVKDRTLNKPLQAEQWVAQEDLMAADQAGLSAIMEKGMRALGVKVDMSAVAGGFVLPNSRVDIVWINRRSDADSSARMILQNVLVLAVGQTSQRPDDKQSMIEPTVTLAVTPEDAEKLTLASEMGSLRLILRPFNDSETVKTSGADQKAITRGSATKDESGDSATEGGESLAPPTKGPAWVNKVPEVPKSEPATPAAAVVEAAKVPDAPKIFTMTIQNGESIKRIKFPIGDENGETIREEIQKSPERTPAPKLESQAPATPSNPTK